MLLAVLLIWLGCLVVFLASSRQKLLKKPLNRKLSWIAFAASLTLGSVLFSAEYGGVIAAIVVLTLVMVIWPLMVFSHGHLKMKLLPFSCGGAALAVALVQLGGL